LINASRRKHHYIYKTICTVSNKYYIGMHSTDDIDDGYLGSGKVLQYSIKKHGKQNHIKEIIEYFPDRIQLALREKELITDDILNDPMCINLRYGGNGGMPGMNVTEETRAKLSKAGKGRPHSEEHKAKIGIANAGKIRTPEMIQNHKDKITGRIQSTEERQMRSEVVKYKKAYNSRAVNVDGIEYVDVQKAAIAIGMSASTLGKQCTSISLNLVNRFYIDTMPN
jgi:group I intron endonuclease